MPHLDLGTYLLDDALSLDNVPSDRHPKGKTYRVPSPTAAFGLQLRRMLDVWGTRDADHSPREQEIAELLELVTGENGEPIDFQRKLLGDAYDEMLADGVSAERLQMISNVVMAHYGMGPHVSQAIIGSSGEAEARPNRATRRATAKKTVGPRSARASTGGATRTRKPASTGSSMPPNDSPEEAKAV